MDQEIITKLERLAQLKAQGILSEEEFQEQKNKILCGDSTDKDNQPIKANSSEPIKTERKKNNKGCLGCLGLFIIFIIISAILGNNPKLTSNINPTSESSNSGNTRSISAKELGDKYPFTVDSGTLECVHTGNMSPNGDFELTEVIFHSGGKTYAVNGIARGTGKYNDMEEIWKPDPQIADLKVNVNTVLNMGLELCE